MRQRQRNFVFEQVIAHHFQRECRTTQRLFFFFFERRRQVNHQPVNLRLQIIDISIGQANRHQRMGIVGQVNLNFGKLLDRTLPDVDVLRLGQRFPPAAPRVVRLRLAGLHFLLEQLLHLAQDVLLVGLGLVLGFPHRHLLLPLFAISGV